MIDPDSTQAIGDKKFFFSKCDGTTVTILNNSRFTQFINAYYWEFNIAGQTRRFNDWSPKISFPDTGYYKGILWLNKGERPITITSATARCKPISGDTTRFKVYTFNANGKPQFVGQSALYKITPADSAAQTITLPLTAPIRINANQKFMISMTEGFSAPSVWGTTQGYEPGNTFVHSLVTYGGWARLDTFPDGTFLKPRFARALAIRPNIQLRTGIGETTYVGKLTLSPNPISGVINLSVDMTTEEDVLVRVYNLSGQVVYTSKFDKVKNIQQDLDLTKQANGIYMVSLTTAKGTLTRKVVKE